MIVICQARILIRVEYQGLLRTPTVTSISSSARIRAAYEVANSAVDIVVIVAHLL